MIERLDRKQFARIAEEWGAIDPDANLFASHAWIRTWLEFFGDEHHVVLTYREGGVLQAGVVFHAEDGTYDQEHEQWPWPWVVARPTLENPYEPFLRYLRSRRGVRRVNFVEAPASAKTWTDASRGYFCLSNFTRNSRAIDVSTTFAEYEKRLKKKVRAELHRRDRHFREDLPTAELVRHDDPVEEFAIISEVEHDSWKEREHTAIISSKRDSAFYAALLALDEPGFSPRLYSLDADAGHIAYVIGILYRGCLYALKTSYQDTYAKLSPGSVLFYRALQEICDEEPDIKTVELLGNDAQWKRHLATSNRELYDYRLLRNTLQNRAYVFAWTRMRPAVKNHRVLGPIYQNVRKRLTSDSK